MNTLRGATTITENTEKEIEEASIELLNELMQTNGLQEKDILALFFSCTKDITKAYPGKYVREHFSLTTTSIMHYNEMDVEGSLPLCIRVLLLTNAVQNPTAFVYLREAQRLRKDLLFDK